MPFTCDGAGLLWPDVAWHLALLAPNLAPRDIVSRAIFERNAPNFRLRIRSSNLQAEAVSRSGVPRARLAEGGASGVDAEHREARGQIIDLLRWCAVIGERDPGLAAPHRVARAVRRCQAMTRSADRWRPVIYG